MDMATWQAGVALPLGQSDEAGGSEMQPGRPMANAEMEGSQVESDSTQGATAENRAQRWLIGPALLPVYALVLKITLAAQVGAFLLIVAPLRVLHGASVLDAYVQSLSTLLFAIWIPVGIVTAIFAAIERTQTDETWATDLTAQLWRQPESAIISRVGEIVQLAVTVGFVAWWLGDAPSSAISAGAVWQTLTHEAYIAVAVYALGFGALAAVNALRPRWTPVRLAFHAVLDLLGAGIALAILYADRGEISAEITTATHTAAGSSGNVALWTDLAIAITLAVVAIVGIVSCGMYSVHSVRLARQN